MLASSAQSWGQKRTSLTQELIRSLLNCSKELHCVKRRKHLNTFMQLLKNTGYNQMFRSEILKSGLNGYRDMKNVSDFFEVEMLKAHRKPFTRLVEEGTYISSHWWKLLNSKSEWHQAKNNHQSFPRWSRDPAVQLQLLTWGLPIALWRLWSDLGPIKSIQLLAISPFRSSTPCPPPPLPPLVSSSV